MTSTEFEQQPRGKAIGTIGFLFGAAAMIMVLVTVTAGPFAPQQSAGVAVGDTAAEIGKAMLRNWVGMDQPAPEARDWDVDRTLWVVTIVAGGLALILGLLALLSGERRMLANFAIGLGVGSLGLQLIAGAFYLIMGVMILCAIIAAFGSFLGDIGLG